MTLSPQVILAGDVLAVSAAGLTCGPNPEEDTMAGAGVGRRRLTAALPSVPATTVVWTPRAAAAAAAPGRNPSTAAPYTFRNVAVGGTGFVTGIVSSRGRWR